MKKILLPLESLISEHFYSPHFFWFRNILLKFQTCLGQGPNARRGGSASTTVHPMQKTDDFHQPTD
jgi:hypothetical protein